MCFINFSKQYTVSKSKKNHFVCCFLKSNSMTHIFLPFFQIGIMRILVISFGAAILALSLSVSAESLKPEDYPPPPPVPSAAALVKPTDSTTVSTTTTSTTTTKPRTTTTKTTLSAKRPSPTTTVVKKLPPHGPAIRPSLKPKRKKVPSSSRPLKKPFLGPKKPNLKTLGPKKPNIPKTLRKITSGPPKKLVKAPAQRRDSSYGAPAAPAPAPPKVIIKQAGPSKQYGWIGHGTYAPLGIKSPFPKDLPKWIPMGNNIFEAGLLYPGKPGGSSFSEPAPAPPPAAPSAVPEYAPAPPPPAPPVPEYQPAPSQNYDSYSAPNSPPAYSPPAPQPVYNPKPTEAPYVPLPPEIPVQPAYQSNVPPPSYGASTLLGQYIEPVGPVTAVPAYTTPKPAAPAPSYSAPITPAPPSYNAPQPSYAPAAPAYNKPAPFTVFGSAAHASYHPATAAAAAAPAPTTIAPPAQPATYKVPAIEAVYEPIDKPGNYPSFNTLPGFAGATYLEPSPNYEAAASYDTPKAVVPSANSFNAYDVPLKVEETYDGPATEEDQDVYFIFYEDNQNEQPSVSYFNSQLKTLKRP